MNFFLVNSEPSLQECLEAIRAEYNEHHWGRVEFIFGSRHSIKQNQMIYKQYGVIAKQLYDGDIEFVKRECKFNLGCPILCAENPAFARMYEKLIAPLVYPDKLAMMGFIQVTSEMTRNQSQRYIKLIFEKYSELDVDWQGLDDEKLRKRYRESQAVGQ